MGSRGSSVANPCAPPPPSVISFLTHGAPTSRVFSSTPRPHLPSEHPFTWLFQVGFVSDSDSDSTSASGSGSASATAAESYGGVNEARWSLEYETGATEQWARIVLACVLVCWVPVWLLWCWVVFCCKAQGGFKVRFSGVPWFIPARAK